jgi:hypothetical protein
MLIGDRTKTVNYTIDYWWEPSGTQDTKLGNAVGSWIGQNARVLDKKRADETIKLITEQFPYLRQVEARHAQLHCARWAR